MQGRKWVVVLLVVAVGVAVAAAAASQKPRATATRVRALETLQHVLAAKLLRTPNGGSVSAAAETEALAHPIDVHAAALRGTRAWLRTVVALDDLFLARDERLACGRAFAALIAKGCAYHIAMVVERTGSDAGIIRRAESDVSPAAAESDAASICRSYGDCIALSRVGETVPLPKEEATIYGIRQEMVSEPLPTEMRDPVRVQQILEELALSVQNALPSANPRDEIALENNRREVEYLKLYLRELQQSSGSKRTP